MMTVPTEWEASIVVSALHWPAPYWPGWMVAAALVSVRVSVVAWMPPPTP